MFSNRLAKMVGLATDEELRSMYQKATLAQQQAFDRRMRVVLRIKIAVLALGLIGIVALHWLGVI